MDKNRYIGIILLVLGILALIGGGAEWNLNGTISTSKIIALVLTAVMIIAGIALIIKSRKQ